MVCLWKLSVLLGKSQSCMCPSALLVAVSKEGIGQDCSYLGSLLRVCGVKCFQYLIAHSWHSNLPLCLLMVPLDCLWDPNWSPPFHPVPRWVDFLCLAACFCLAQARGKHSQCHSPSSSLVNFRTSKDMLCLSLLFSIPDTYTNVFNAHFLCLRVALGSPNGDPVVLCFLVYIA